MIYILIMILRILKPHLEAQNKADIQPSKIVSSSFFPQKNEKTTVAGHWEGTITRDEGGGKRTTFAMELDVVQKDKNVTGLSYVSYEDGAKKYAAQMDVKGKVNGTYFKYLETKIVKADSIPDNEWCIKKADLIFRIQNDKPTLEGIWEGTTNVGKCTPGRIFLQKRPPRV